MPGHLQRGWAVPAKTLRDDLIREIEHAQRHGEADVCSLADTVALVCEQWNNESKALTKAWLTDQLGVYRAKFVGEKLLDAEYSDSPEWTEEQPYKIRWDAGGITIESPRGGIRSFAYAVRPAVEVK